MSIASLTDSVVGSGIKVGAGVAVASDKTAEGSVQAAETNKNNVLAITNIRKMRFMNDPFLIFRNVDRVDTIHEMSKETRLGNSLG